MKRKDKGNAIMIVRMYNHTNGDDFQFEVQETMLHLCNRVMQELIDDYKINHADNQLQYLDFEQGRGYPCGCKK